jgi:hypothetical protein
MTLHLGLCTQRQARKGKCHVSELIVGTESFQAVDGELLCYTMSKVVVWRRRRGEGLRSPGLEMNRSYICSLRTHKLLQTPSYVVHHLECHLFNSTTHSLFSALVAPRSLILAFFSNNCYHNPAINISIGTTNDSDNTDVTQQCRSEKHQRRRRKLLQHKSPRLHMTIRHQYIGYPRRIFEHTMLHVHR